MLHAHVGFMEFLVVACYVILFALAWRTVMYKIRDNHPDLAGAMAVIL